LLLEADPEFEITGDAPDAPESVASVEEVRPEVLHVDLMMPGLSGLEVTRQVSQRFPETRVLVLSAYTDDNWVQEALGNGAAG
jgi:two-component system response regulator NreC